MCGRRTWWRRSAVSIAVERGVIFVGRGVAAEARDSEGCELLGVSGGSRRRRAAQKGQSSGLSNKSARRRSRGWWRRCRADDRGEAQLDADGAGGRGPGAVAAGGAAKHRRQLEGLERFEQWTSAGPHAEARRLAVVRDRDEAPRAGADGVVVENQTKSAQVTQWLVELLKAHVPHLLVEQLLDLVAMMSKNEVKAGTELIVQGDLGSSFTSSTSVASTSSSEGGVGPARRVAHWPASWFGEPALLYGSKRGALVKATKDSVVWALDREQYKWVLMAENRKVRDGTSRTQGATHSAHPHTTHPLLLLYAGPRRRVPRVERRLARRAVAQQLER